ncbi:glycosyltransferase family 2 protein [Rhizobium leguminosarum]|uniref:glycosyltransferase n=1 Tax=Rhizobium leguminosarum TaxID=384 RepID=UPI0010301ACC|nr:glycosyltransferase family 2 protein [Rhizobium leguminosarum]MBY2962036.1 glycosyltransferase family 2 protein [Rhizobium leguminosarum]TAY18248.1 glycosyltransferase family 2 protein [Rhizobium leguminosarum]
MTDLHITVVFSSYNGTKRLQRMLDSLVKQDLAHDQWDVIAVDNNSSDGTGELLRSYVDTLPLTVMTQTMPGKSAALNAALELTRGTLIVLTDDDIRAEPDWLSSLADCARKNPQFGILGGRILPEWEHSPEGEFLDWIPMGSTFAIVDDAVSGPCESTKVWGPNTAIRREALADIRYREDMGPVPGGHFAMGEDQDIVMRLAARNVTAYRCAEAVVHHWIAASSVSEDWVQKRGERLGYGVPALFPNDVPAGPRIAGVPFKTWIESANWALRAALLYPLPRSKKRFWAIWKYYYMRGYRAGIRRYAPQTLAR